MTAIVPAAGAGIAATGSGRVPTRSPGTASKGADAKPADPRMAGVQVSKGDLYQALREVRKEIAGMRPGDTAHGERTSAEKGPTGLKR